MSAGWEVGDLAQYVGHQTNCLTCIGDAPVADPVGINCVRQIVRNPDGDAIGTCGLVFGGLPLCSCGFRKILPDPHEGNAEDWNLILDSVKREGVKA